MAYKNLLLHVDDTKACAGRIEAAVEFARTQGAHLTGLSIAAAPVLPGYIRHNIPEDALRAQEEYLEEQAEKALARFRKAGEANGLPYDSRVDHCLYVDVARTIVVHARYSDMVILGQSDPDESGAGGRHMVEEVILSCGRPCLVIPYIGAGKTLGRRVMVAWDAGREAARAVNDAMPLLETAESVTVLAVNPRAGDEGHGEEPGADIALHLARHNVKAEVRQTRVEDIEIGEAILSLIADSDSDVLVMGAYAHSRLRELVLGGVTRTMLREMTVPVLMSH